MTRRSNDLRQKETIQGSKTKYFRSLTAVLIQPTGWYSSTACWHKFTEINGLVPASELLNTRLKNYLNMKMPPQGNFFPHGDSRGTKDRTRDTRFWRPLLYQLSYTPRYEIESGPSGTRTPDPPVMSRLL